MGRAEKEYMVDEIKKNITQRPNLYLSNFININAEQLNELRNELAKESSCYFVVKNKLCKLALKEAKLDKLTELVDGPAGFVLCGDNAISISKILADFSKRAEGFSIIGGYVDGELLLKEEVQELASLPSHKELLAMFAYALKAPISQFVSVFRQLIRGFTFSLSEISKKKAEKEKNN